MILEKLDAVEQELLQHITQFSTGQLQGIKFQLQDSIALVIAELAVRKKQEQEDEGTIVVKLVGIIEDRALLSISNGYRNLGMPVVATMDQFKAFLQKKGINLIEVKFKGFELLESTECPFVEEVKEMIRR